MPAQTPIERAVATYCEDWGSGSANESGIAKVNPETLGDATSSDFKFRYIDISSVSKGVIDWSLVEELRFGDAPSRARRVLRHGDAMICTVRPLLGSHAFADWPGDYPTLCSTGFAVVRCENRLLPNFLKHVLFSEQTTRQLVAWQCGTSYPAVNERDIRRLKLPIPSKDEQACIARVLDSVDEAIESTRAAVDRARDLRRGLLQEAFEFAHSNETKKHTDAGLIPESWDAIKGRHAFVIVTGGCSSIDVLRRPRNGAAPDAWFMKVDDFNLPSNRRKIVHTKIGFRVAENRIFKPHPPGTLVIAKRGAAILKNRVRATTVPIALDPNLMAL